MTSAEHNFHNVATLDMISNGYACPKRLLTRLVSWELSQVPHSQSWTKLINLQVSMQQKRRLERRLLMNTYNHIYGLSISGLQSFTILCAKG
jgi:hypothetical protein